MIKILGNRLFFIALFSFLSIHLYGGSVKVSVDEKEVILGDSILFTITVVGQESDPLPEMDSIGGVEVDNIMRHKGSDFVYVDGKSVMENTESITFEFKPTQNMTIPAFQLKVDGVLKTTDAINLTVRKLEEGEIRKNKYFSIDLKLNKSKVYLGEAVIATVFLRQKSALDIMSLDYKKPEFKNFFSKQLGEEKKYTEESDTVYELSYLLSPKKEGVLQVEPATAKIAQRVREKQVGGWFANVPKWSNLSSTELNLTVVKPTEDYDLMGNFTLTDTLDIQKVKLNKPVNLKVEIRGEGSFDDFEGLVFDLDGVTIYSEDAIIESKFEKESLKSHYSKSFAFISDHNFVIPPKSIRLFDYTTGQVKVLKTRGYHIIVEGGKKVAKVETIHTKNPVPIQSNQKETDTNQLSGFTVPSFLILFLTFILGIFATLFFRILLPILKQFLPFISKKWRDSRLGFDGYEALTILYPHIGENREVEEMVRRLYAIKNGDNSVEIDKELLKRLVKEYQVKTKN